MAAELEQLRVSLVAELVGMEAFEQLKRKVNEIEKSIGGLDNTQQKFKKGVGDAEKAIRQQRQAFSQTGMQINQFAGQVAAGTPLMTAFVQQIGDVTYTLGQAGGALGKFGQIMGGPVVTGLLVATSIFVPLIMRMRETKEASTELDNATTNRVESEYNVRLALAKTSEAYIAIRREMYKTAQAAMITQLGVVKTALVLQQSLMRRRDALREQVSSAGGLRAQAEMATGVSVELFNVNRELTTSTEVLNAETAKLEAATTTVNNMFAAGIKSAGSFADKSDKATSSVKKQVEEAQSFGDSLQDTMKALDSYSKAYGLTTQSNIKDSVAAFDAQRKLQEEVKNYNFSENMEKSFEKIDRVKSMSEAMGQAFSNGIKGMITGAMNFKQVMSNVIDSVISKLFEMFVVQQIVGMIGKGISAVTGIKIPVSGAKAIGGPVQAGGAYMVGERGPEMFVPSRSGSIVPNKGLGGGMTINVDARGSADPGAVRAQVELGIAQAAPYIIAAAQNRTLKTAGRARLPGTIG